MMDENPVTVPNIDRAGGDHPVMHNPRNEARAAFFKKYKKHAPEGWPYTEKEVDEANQLLGIHEAADGDADTDDNQAPPNPEMDDMMKRIAMFRLSR